MKKIILIFMLLAAAASVFAGEDVVRYDTIDFTFVPASARYEGMGASGAASSSRLDSFFRNPAVLAGSGFSISIPSVSMTVFNLNRNLKDENVRADIEAIEKNEADASTYTDLLQRYISNLGTGHNLVSQIDVSTAVKALHVGLGTDLQIRIHSLSNGSASLANMTLIPEVNASETIALGFNIVDTDYFTFSVGGSAHFVVKQYYKGIAANTVLAMMDDENPDFLKMLVWDTPIMGGFAVPCDLGVTMKLGQAFVLSASATNLNGTYHMKSYSSEGDYCIANNIAPELPMPEDHEAKESVAFEIETPWELNFGLALAPQWKVIRPVISADLVDMAGMVRSISEGEFRAEDLLLHLNAGAEIGILDIVKVRAGINRGYMSVGLGLNIFIAQMDVAYGWREMGAQIGDKPVDALTVRFNLGYDR